MRFCKNKSFKTIILTKKTIIIFLCLFFLICIFSFLFKNVSYKKNYVSTEDFHKMIISSKLNSDNNHKSSIKKIITAILGFDIKNPQTILYNYSPQFMQIKNTVNQNDAIYPQAPQKPTTLSEKGNVLVEEISASKGLDIQNGTNIEVDVNALLKKPISYSLDKNDCHILIVHTHTTESYSGIDSSKYQATNTDRNTDEEKNMIAVGEVICDILSKNKITAIHDKTFHDYPAYSGSYDRSKKTVLNNLNKDPKIKIVIDVHRDAIIRKDGTKVKVASDINGKKAAQCMFVIGTNSELSHDNWQENLLLATKIQKRANDMYEGLMRPINLRCERFNQQLSKGSVILEVGTCANTLEEARYSAELFANVLVSLFEK